MALIVSTAMRNQLLDGGSLKDALASSLIFIYSGAPPANADSAVTGVLLTTISVNSTGTGVNLGDAVDGAIPKEPSEAWSGVNVATGTAGYFRWGTADDDGTLSTAFARLQGTCGLAGADLNMSSVNLVASATQTIDAATIAMPATA